MTEQGQLVQGSPLHHPVFPGTSLCGLWERASEGTARTALAKSRGGACTQLARYSHIEMTVATDLLP